jgi:hypothetical protein
MAKAGMDGRNQGHVVERFFEVAFESRRFRPLVIGRAHETLTAEKSPRLIAGNPTPTPKTFEKPHS